MDRNRERERKKGDIIRVNEGKDTVPDWKKRKYEMD